jgi:hypothetical protein
MGGRCYGLARPPISQFTLHSPVRIVEKSSEVIHAYCVGEIDHIGLSISVSVQSNRQQSQSIRSCEMYTSKPLRLNRRSAIWSPRILRSGLSPFSSRWNIQKGILSYKNQQFELEFSHSTTDRLTNVLRRMKDFQDAHDVNRSHQSRVRCANCVAQKMCFQSLA